MTRALQTAVAHYRQGRELVAQGHVTKAGHCYRQALFLLERYIEIIRDELADLASKEE